VRAGEAFAFRSVASSLPTRLKSGVTARKRHKILQLPDFATEIPHLASRQICTRTPFLNVLGGMPCIVQKWPSNAKNAPRAKTAEGASEETGSRAILREGTLATRLPRLGMVTSPSVFGAY
jgi:hypothetical protein